MKWSLDELYTSFDSKEFKDDFKEMKESVEKLKVWAAENFTDDSEPVKKIEYYVNTKNNFERFEKIGSYAHLTISVESENTAALKAQGLYENVASEMSGPDVLFKGFLIKFDDNRFDEIINSSDLLKKHEYYLKSLRMKNKFSLSEKEEIVYSKMKITGSRAWNTLKEQLFSNLLVDININGEQKQLPATVVRNYAHVKDGAIRKTAYEAELEAYKKIEKPVAFCLNSIKGEVLTNCRLRKYESPLSMTLINADLEKNALDAMFSAINDYLPKFRQYYRKKAELLGHKNGLPFYDIFAPMGESKMNFTFEEASEFVIKNFTAFSDKLGNFAKTAIERHWIDVEPRVGKRGGAFCSNLHPIKESRFMLNFTGSLKDVITLAHELGHGYHGFNLKDETYLNSHYSMPIAETASTFCETLVTNAAIKTASKEEAFTILETEILDAGQVIVDIYSRFLFEDELLKRRENGMLSVDELKEMMIDAQMKAYGDGLDENCLHPYMWINKPHYYYADRNYYNFPYAYGSLFSKGLFKKYLDDKESFIKNYDTLLSKTGKNDLRSIGLVMDIDVNEKSFWESSLQVISEQIDEFLKA